MKSINTRQLLLKEVQEEFSRNYPYLKIDFTRGKGEKRVASINGAGKTDGASQPDDQGESIRSAAQKLLWTDFGVSDNMKVSELEVLLQYEFGLPAQVLRKSGNLWLETSMTDHWTLRQQNDRGQDMALGFA
ncbi:hypothetical protein Q4E93_02650 [Flavitalea sp. BT771]|uniref:hypothetical protein n=1 Tax=Flavitalea sp. BT771 TaxID=3063329 RepID=UPI0026E40D12|nr:hypothetical protein [Flavitalea sp. BT771]MDO6429471.1 hypothetical protein [Flavitalea sp. BT771]MDV6218401.1 hypothetical protein [Flavitalea sp. BT771]